ncbi:zinc finger, CCHC-type containing protein [Tanacetum coccineum]
MIIRRAREVPDIVLIRTPSYKLGFRRFNSPRVQNEKIYNLEKYVVVTASSLFATASHEGYRNAIELPEEAKVSTLRSDTIWIVDSINLNGATRNTTRLRLFYFSLHNQAINWLDHLPLGSISTWDDLTTRFLAQFFPPGRTAKLRKDILMFQQHQDESIWNAWNQGGRVRKLRPEEAWETIEDLAQYEEEEWNEPIFSEKESPDYIDANLE